MTSCAEAMHIHAPLIVPISAQSLQLAGCTKETFTVIKPTLHHASRNQTSFLSKWRIAWFLPLKSQMASSSAANSAFRQSGLLALCCRVRSDSLYFLSSISLSPVSKSGTDAFILPWQSMTTTVHCERAFSRNSSLNNENTACVYWPSCCSKPRHFCLWNIKREFQCIIAVILQYHFIWN